MISGEVDSRFIDDFQYFVFTKSTKSLVSIRTLAKIGHFEDVFILLRSMFEGYLASRFIDEKFDGTIWHMYVPADVIALASEIDEFQTNYGKVSPFSSESFGGYSYSKQFTGWKDAFADKLKKWRKI